MFNYKLALKNIHLDILYHSHLQRGTENKVRDSFLVKVDNVPSNCCFFSVPKFSEQTCLEISEPLLKVMKNKNKKTLRRLSYSKRENVKAVATYLLIHRANSN